MSNEVRFNIHNRLRVKRLFVVVTLTIVSGIHAFGQPDPKTKAADVVLQDAIADANKLGWSKTGLAEVSRMADSLGSAAILIVTDGKVVFSYGDVSRNFRAHSIRKSFLSALYGIAVAEGQIDPRMTLAKLGIDDKTPLTRSEKRATINDLLKSRSGVYLPAASEVASARKSRPKRHQFASGKHWYYNNWDFNVLGSIYRQEIRKDIFEAFESRIATPIGMEDFELANTRYQYEKMSKHPSYKFRISTRDLARFGLLYLNNGFWQGKQIVSADWIDLSTRSYSETGGKGTKSGYGMMWWVLTDSNERIKFKVASGAYTASGTGGHRLTIFPKIKTLVVHRMNTDRSGGARIGSSTYDRFLIRVLEARVKPKN